MNFLTDYQIFTEQVTYIAITYLIIELGLAPLDILLGESFSDWDLDKGMAL